MPVSAAADDTDLLKKKGGGMEDGQKKHNVIYLPAFLTQNTLWCFQNVETETYAK